MVLQHDLTVDMQVLKNSYDNEWFGVNFKVRIRSGVSSQNFPDFIRNDGSVVRIPTEIK